MADAHKQKVETFSRRGAMIGLAAYIVLVLIIMIFI